MSRAPIPKIRLGASADGSACALPPEIATKATAILGRRRTGKTYTMLLLCEQIARVGVPLVVLDPLGVCWGLRVPDGPDKWCVDAIILGGPHADIDVKPDQGEEIGTFLDETDASAIIDLSEFASVSHQRRFAMHLLQRLYKLRHRRRRPIHVAIDEADIFAPQLSGSGLKEGEGSAPGCLAAVDNCVRRGGSLGFGMSLTTQRLAVVSKTVITQCDQMIALSLRGKVEVKLVSDWMASNAPMPDGFGASLPTLKRGRGYVFCPTEQTEAVQLVDFDRRQTLDTSYTPEIGGRPLRAAATARTTSIESLRARLEALAERDEAQKPEKKATAGPSQAEIDDAVRRAFKDGADSILGNVAQLVERASRVAHEARIIESELAGLVARPGPVAEDPASPAPAASLSSVFPKPLSRYAYDAGEEVEPAKAPPAGKAIAARRIARALGMYADLGLNSVSRENVAVVAGMSPASSAFTGHVAALRTAKHIVYPAEGMLAITSEGRVAWDVPQGTHKFGQKDLQAAWMASSALSDAEKRLLGVLLAEHPKALTREQLAGRAGVSHKSSAYTADVARLSTLGIARYPQNGSVALTDLLFPAGLKA